MEQSTTGQAQEKVQQVAGQAQDKAQEAIEQGRTEDSSTFLIEWSADPALDYRDERAWQQANPSLGNGRLTLATLRGEMETKSELARMLSRRIRAETVPGYSAA